MNGKAKTKKVNKQENGDSADLNSDGKQSLSLRKKLLQRLKKKTSDVEADIIINIDSTNSISEDSTIDEIRDVGDSTTESTAEDNDGNGIDIVPETEERAIISEGDIELISLTKKLANQPKLINLDEAYYVEQHLSKEDVPVTVNTSDLEIEFKENDVLDYAVNFLPKEHQNFIGEDETKNVIAVSVIKSSNSSHSDSFRALVRTEQRDEHMEISNKSKARRSLSRQEIISALKPRFSLRSLVKADDPKIKENLVILEKSQYVKRYKFGVLYCKTSQSTESEMFSNVSGSAQWDEFLELLGNKIELKGWPEYSGGLDVRYNATGTHSVFREWKNFQIMFHVSTLLPYSAGDLQQLERKRHIGNDVVIVIFKEPNTSFDPRTISSHFNHVTVIIEPFVTEGETFYRMEVSSKIGVPYFGPKIMQPLFKKDEYFRDFLLTKMVNGERAAYHAPEFRPKITRTRSQILHDCANVAKPNSYSSATINNKISIQQTNSSSKSTGSKKASAIFGSKSTTEADRKKVVGKSPSAIISPTSSILPLPTSSSASSTASASTQPGDEKRRSTTLLVPRKKSSRRLSLSFLRRKEKV